MSDELRMTAAVEDRASGPLINIAKRLGEIKTPPALGKISEQLAQIDQRARSLATGGWSMMTSAMGFSGFTSVSAGLGLLIERIGKLAQASTTLRQLSRETGATMDQLRTLRDAGDHLGVPAEQMDRALGTLSRKLVQFRRLHGELFDALRVGIGMPGVMRQLQEADGQFEKQVGIILGALSKVQGKNAADTAQLQREWAEKYFGDGDMARLIQDPEKFKRVIAEAQKRTAATPLAEFDKQSLEAKESLKKFNDELDRFTKEIAPGLMRGLTGLMQFLDRFGKTGKGDWDSFKSLFGFTSGQGADGAGGLAGLIHKASLNSGTMPSFGRGPVGDAARGGAFSSPGSRSPLPPAGPGTGIGHAASRADREAFIRREAEARGIDPAIAMRIARSEGFNRYVGDGGRSFGDFQLFSGGGLGNEFQRETGLDPRDPKTWREQTRWALDWAAKNRSWRPWHGRGPAGVGTNEGFGRDAKPLGWKPRGDEPPEAKAPSEAGDGRMVAQSMLDNFRRFSSEYGMRRHPLLGGMRLHAGTDMSAPAGSAFRSRLGGEVTNISPSGDITVRYADGSTGTYRHGAPSVSVGDHVKQGQQLGTLRGNDPRSTGPHLHYEGRRPDGSLYDAGELLRSRPGGRLPPVEPKPLVNNWPSGWRPPAWMQSPPDAKKMPDLDGSVHLTIEHKGGGSGDHIRVNSMDGIMKGSTIKRRVQGDNPEVWV